MVQRITYARSESDATVRATGREPNKSDRATKRTVARGALSVRNQTSPCTELGFSRGHELTGMEDSISDLSYALHAEQHLAVKGPGAAAAAAPVRVRTLPPAGRRSDARHGMVQCSKTHQHLVV